MDSPVTDAPEPSRIAETHISTLVFAGDRVYKAKKPVRTAFLDFTTVDARRAACHREVELNRRLAADVYLGVADVTMDGRDLDHLVVMLRLPEDRRLSRRLDVPTVDDDLRHLAHLIATFHDSARRGPEIDAASGHAAVADLWEDGIDQLAELAADVVDVATADRVALLAREYLAGRAPLLDDRIRLGRACDGHGDLQAEDIFVLDDGPRVLDCLEFDDRLRYGDVLADVAFLAMDLERLGRPDLGQRFIAGYRALSGDSWPASLAHLHIAYRAHVRAKVACIRHHQGDPDAGAGARALLQLALEHLEAARVRLVLVGGSPGTGKSTLASQLAGRLGAVLVSSDEMRDEILPGAPGPNDEVHGGRYRPDLVAQVYDEILHRAEVLVERGERVVLDASWLDPVHRTRARDLAARTSCQLTELRCTCPVELAMERVEQRAARGDSISEATPDIARRLSTEAAPWPEATEVPTDGSLPDPAGRAEAAATRQ